MQVDAAKLLGVSQSTISRWLNRKVEAKELARRLLLLRGIRELHHAGELGGGESPWLVTLAVLGDAVRHRAQVEAQARRMLLEMFNRQVDGRRDVWTLQPGHALREEREVRCLDGTDLMLEVRVWRR
jgi:transcriptional regulator with XRE-family HTH domain